MTYPPHLPTVLVSVLNSVEGSPGRKPRRTSGTQTSHSRHRLTSPDSTTQLARGRLYLWRRTLIKVVGVAGQPARGVRHIVGLR